MEMAEGKCGSDVENVFKKIHKSKVRDFFSKQTLQKFPNIFKMELDCQLRSILNLCPTLSKVTFSFEVTASDPLKHPIPSGEG